jgi:pilus assembly protein CpaC
VELGKGQSFAIGGLLDNRTTETLSKIPYISNLPILGKFFQSISKNKTNSELIVIVTPEIVQAVPEGTIANPNFAESFLPPNSTTPMHHPDGTGNNPSAAAAPVSNPPAQATIPVEQLMNQMKNEPHMVDNGGSYGGSDFGSSGASSGTPSTPSTPQ